MGAGSCFWRPAAGTTPAASPPPAPQAYRLPVATPPRPRPEDGHPAAAVTPPNPRLEAVAGVLDSGRPTARDRRRTGRYGEDPGRGHDPQMRPGRGRHPRRARCRVASQIGAR
ncbi:MAG: hypothetical protein COZ96_10910 [Nitrospirae bacterium CG_4_8_14_3_um_filter_70_85]|nr:MAG: hypothetical protein COS73_03265 [Nitrospirae bacterium CG06_land_8_20_14_3_00_70_43]PIW82016.1 MAG: hypothetical protein COZ96_10910 [Nitrospirae bacterium CG_4_8_14_3_um_filter_70_85]PIX83904.1 MAG: hypothetical protein COZ33_03025 [Nitrospirae bacterium CG_4_10_14_3_um_filter_70_108]HBB40134.1 hypothetical protein [Pseudomonadota bacterium]